MEPAAGTRDRARRWGAIQSIQAAASKLDQTAADQVLQL
jgi:hypothetical protein